MIARPLLVSMTAAALATATLLSPGGVHAAHMAGPSVKSVSLTLQDVQKEYGASFRPFIQHTYPASKYKVCGANYLGAYASTFGNFKKATGGTAVVSVTNTVDVFASSSSSACAAKMSATGMVKLAQKSPSKVTVRLAPLSGVGDTAYMLTMVTAAQPHRSYSTMIQLSRGNYGATLMVSGIGGQPSRAGVIALARLQDARLQAASHS
jgi:hypothetical protein